MDNLSLIVAIGKNNELGIDNHLIWNLKGDMKFFKETTTNHTVIMGRKTYESIGRLLPNRENIIITKDESYRVDGAIILHDFDELIKYIGFSNNEFFVIGGASIYKELLPYSSKLYITEIDEESKADTYFTRFNKRLYAKRIIKKNDENGIKYNFVLYTKKSI